MSQISQQLGSRRHNKTFVMVMGIPVVTILGAADAAVAAECRPPDETVQGNCGRNGMNFT